MNLAKTPIALSLNKVMQDAKSVEGPVTVVLVSDGEETCGGDPEQSIKTLINKGVAVNVNIIGFAIDEFTLKDTFTKWAEIGHGAYFDASNASQLAESILSATQASYVVVDENSNEVMRGIINGPQLRLPVGKYTIKSSAKTPEDAPYVSIDNEQTSFIQL